MDANTTTPQAPTTVAGPPQPHQPMPGQTAWFSHPHPQYPQHPHHQQHSPTVQHAGARTSRLPSAAETLGWGGGLTTLIGVAAVTWDFWTSLSDLGLVLLLSLATAVLGIAASVVGDLDRRHGDRLAANLSVGLWWMTGIAWAFTVYMGGEVIAGGRAFLPLLAASAASTAMVGAAAYRTRSDSALAGTIIGGALTAFAAAAMVSATAPQRSLAIWATALAATVAITLLSQDHRVSFATGLALLFGASQGVLALGGGIALAVVVVIGTTTAAGLTIGRRHTGEVWTTAVLAALLAVQVLFELAPQVFSLSTSILVSGIAMTVGCIHLVRRSNRPAPTATPPAPSHGQPPAPLGEHYPPTG
ncbi:hypothetical protein BH23ACT9_BH23ACT9_32640 [soil metagenome]